MTIRSVRFALATAVVALCALFGLAPANATTVTIDGYYTVSYMPLHGNSPTFTYDLKHTSSKPFVEKLILDATNPTTAVPFFAINPSGSCGSTCVKGPNEGTANHHLYYYTASGIVTVQFDFKGLTVLSGSTSDTGLYQAKYGGLKLPCATNSSNGDTDCINWTTTINGVVNPLVVNFSNGDTLDIFLSNAEDWSITPKISFQLFTTPSCSGPEGCAPPPGTPLPGTLPLFASGAGLLGFLGLRRKKKRELVKFAAA